jgi:hypothetical protein
MDDMDGVSAATIIKVVAQYGVLGLGWVAWILTMFYLQVERKRYQALVIHIIGYFTKVNISEQKDELFSDDESKHRSTFTKLLGK